MPQENNHSREINEIMGKMPPWIIRWGITVIFAIFIGILIGCYFVKYPQMVQVPVVIKQLDNDVVGIAKVPASSFLKIKNGQEANIKLNVYSYTDYGLLKGVVKDISKIPNEDNTYTIEILFPNGLITTHNKQLEFLPHMDGTADIIVNEMRLIGQYVQSISRK